MAHGPEEDAYTTRELCGEVTQAWARAPEVWFAPGFSFSKQGKWSSAEEAKYSAYVDMWAWALLMLQLATGKAPLSALKDIASAQLLLEAMGLSKCPRVVHGRQDVCALAMQESPRFKMGYWQECSLRSIIQKCLSWSPEARHRARVVAHTLCSAVALEVACPCTAAEAACPPAGPQEQ